MERKQFTFYKSFYFALKNLQKRDRLAVYDALVLYGLFGIEPEELTQRQQDFFDMMRPNLDASAKRAAQTIEPEENFESKNKVKIKDKEKKKEKEKSKGNSLYSAPAREQTDFLSFWDKYPNKLDREEALAEWQQLATDETVADQILDGLKAWKKTAQWKQDGGRFVPTAANFLKRGYWDVMPPKAQTGKKGNPSGTLGAVELENIRWILEQ